jgi:hypothetical protein
MSSSNGSGGGRRVAKATVTVSIKPEEAEAHFGSLGMFMGLDLSASSAITQAKLKWKPTGPGLIADLDEVDYRTAQISWRFSPSSSARTNSTAWIICT